MTNIKSKIRSSSLLLVSLLLLVTLLAACGDEKTPVPASPGITVPKTAVATSAPATTKAATTSGLGLDVAGASEVQTDNAFSGAVSKLLTGAKNVNVWLYISGDSPEKLAGSFDTSIVAKGYSAMMEKPSKSGNTYVGIYSKTGSDDLILTTLQVPKDAAELSKGLNMPGISEDTTKAIYQQIKGKTSVAFIFSGQDLVKAVFSAATAETTATATTAATTGNPTATPKVEATAAATQAPAVTPITSGPGSELVGTLIATENLDVKIKKVERYNELKYEGKTVKPKGSFLVISYDYANIGKTPVAIVSLTLKDGQDREFESSYDSDVSGALRKMGYTSSFVVNPGFIGSEYRVYDVPADAKDFKLVSFFDTERKPSAESFNTRGGKGADSGAGAELVGQTKTIASDKTDVKVLSVERVNPVKDGSTSYKSDGTFLIVTYEMTNNGDKATTGPTFYLQDSDGRNFSSTDNFEVAYAVAKNAKTKFDSSVNPGQKGVSYRVFEVTKDSTGFKLAEMN